MKAKLVLWAAAFVLTLPIEAHHSAAMFDTSTPIRLKGVIAEVHFANPHSEIFVDVASPDGQRVRWAIENSGTLSMTRDRGFNEKSLQAGDPIEVCGYAPRHPYSSSEELTERGIPIPGPWWGKWDRVITGRLLVLKSGPAEDWSHYGPLDACRSLLGLN